MTQRNTHHKKGHYRGNAGDDWWRLVMIPWRRTYLGAIGVEGRRESHRQFILRRGYPRSTMLFLYHSCSGVVRAGQSYRNNKHVTLHNSFLSSRIDTTSPTYRNGCCCVNAWKSERCIQRPPKPYARSDKPDGCSPLSWNRLIIFGNYSRADTPLSLGLLDYLTRMRPFTDKTLGMMKVKRLMRKDMSSIVIRHM